MGAYNVGLKKLELGTFDPVTGAASAWVELEVYRDTLTINEAPATETKHYRAGKADPVKVALQNGATMASFKVLDTNPDTIMMLLGGTVTTVNSKKIWKKDATQKSEIIKAMRATTNDGYAYTITRGSLRAAQDFNFAENSILLLDVVVEVTDPNIPNVPASTWAEV
jgi:hypothetical protein